MKKVKQWTGEKIRDTAKKVVDYSVGKSIWPFGHEMKIPESVERWVVENRDKE